MFDIRASRENEASRIAGLFLWVAKNMERVSFCPMPFKDKCYKSNKNTILIGEKKAMAYSYGDPRKFTKGEVNRAGEKLVKDKHDQEALEIVNNWRNSHSYILNTFQATLRTYVKNNPQLDVTFAQRLKRLSTILDKIETGRSKDLAAMHDLAGCRLIFPSTKNLEEFREIFHRTRAKHERIDNDKYNYIKKPKSTGYRGIHEVYKYKVSTHTGSVYNNLKIEIQYRTRFQHAWATAVEISDILDGERIKFDKGANPNRERFFLLASELIARNHENVNGYLSGMSDYELKKEMSELEADLNILGTLHAARRSEISIPAKKYLVLRIHNDELSVKGFSEPKDAIAFRDNLEKSNPSDDIVYVSAPNARAVADAFKNYFRDAADFVDMLRPFITD